jgi:hypothetical protein
VTDRERREQATDVTAAALSLLAAGALGPLGALAGPVLRPAVGMAVDEVADAYLARSRLSSGQMLEQTADRLQVDMEQLVKLITEAPRLTQIAGEALDAAARTALDHKIRALARALASAIHGDDAQVDEDQLIIHSLADLEAPHIKLLYALSVMYSEVDEGTSPAPFTVLELQRRLPHLGRPVRALLAPLEARGCVAQEPFDARLLLQQLRTDTDLRPGRPSNVERQPQRWKITGHGGVVLEYLGRVELKGEHRAIRTVRLRGGSRDGEDVQLLPDQPVRLRVADSGDREDYFPTGEVVETDLGWQPIMEFRASTGPAAG